MKPCRLKIITACISENENESDTEEIHYVSQNKKFSYQYNDDNKISEEEKNINNIQNEEEEREIIIRDKDELKTKKRISKGKVYLIDGLFTKNYSGTKKRIFQNKNIDNSLSNEINDKNTKKLHSRNKNNPNINKNGKKIVYTYKWEHNYDNKINTIYDSKEKANIPSSNIKDKEKLSSPPKKPPTFDYYHNNKKIKPILYNENNPELINDKTNLNQALSYEIDREDELKGEIIILKNKHEILFNTLAQEEKKIKQYKEDIKNKTDYEKIKLNQKNKITNFYNNINESLAKGELLLITKPDLYNNIDNVNSKNVEKNNNNEDNIDIKENNITNEINNNKAKNENINLETNLEIIKEIEFNNELGNYLHYDLISLLLKGYFINMNLNNIDKILDKIWIKEKPLQTLETLTEELLVIIDNYINNSNSTFINEHNSNIILNYLYSFSNNYNYITINEFKSIFSTYLGYFIEYNENYLINKLYKYCNGKLSEFIKLLEDIDINKSGKIDIHDFIETLKEKNLIFNYKIDEEENKQKFNSLEQNDFIDILQLLIIDMKRNEEDPENNENIFDNQNKDNNTNYNESKNVIKNNICIYELYYKRIINIIKNNNKNEIPLYKGIIKKYLVDNNINSMMDFMNPLLINNDIIINQGLNKFIKNQTLNNFLISHKVIGENEIFLLPSDEESLIDINQLVAEIDQAKPLLNEFEEKREKLINDVLNDISDN